MFAVLATLLPSLATAWISYVENKRALTAKASEELLGLSTQAARELDLWTKERRYGLRVFASSYEVTENVERIPRVKGEAVRSGNAYQRLTDYLNSVRDRFVDYDELLVLDAHGHIIASSDKQPRALVLPPDWQAQMRGDNLVLGAAYWDSTAARPVMLAAVPIPLASIDRKSTRLNSSHLGISYAVFCLKKKNKIAGEFDQAVCVGLHLYDQFQALA